MSVAWRVSRPEKKLLTLPEHLSSPCTVCVFQSLVFYFVLCRSLFVLLHFLVWLMCCQFFFGLRLLSTPLLSPNLPGDVVFFYVHSPASANNKIKCHDTRYHWNIVESCVKHQLTNSNKNVYFGLLLTTTYWHINQRHLFLLCSLNSTKQLESLRMVLYCSRNHL